MFDAVTFPIAEIFVAPQGEATFAGTMMMFIRLAGCTVGRQFTLQEKAHFQITNNYQTKCTAWDGTEFACDTDYRSTQFMQARDVADFAMLRNVKRVCLTGGEPLMHKELHALVNRLTEYGLRVHIETSGTQPLKEFRAKVHNNSLVWITVSPKKGYLPAEIECYADEIKILVDEETSESGLIDFIRMFTKPIWIQPINGEKTINQKNVEKCLKIMEKHPDVRLSIQLHKVIGTR